MEKLRKPFFVAAILLAMLCIAVEAGSSFWQRSQDEVSKTAAVSDKETADLIARSGEKASPPRPGIGIISLIALDVLALFTMGLMVSPYVISHRLTGRLQGCVTFIVALLMLLGCLLALLAAFAKTMLMVGLFCAPPFGTAAYVLTWGFFDTDGAAVTLGLLLMLKLGFAACLLLASQRFAKSKGLVLFLATSLLATLIVQFLHSLVPGLLVSITDGVAAIVVLILALIWLIAMLFGSIVSIVKALA